MYHESGFTCMNQLESLKMILFDVRGVLSFMTRRESFPFELMKLNAGKFETYKPFGVE